MKEYVVWRHEKDKSIYAEWGIKNFQLWDGQIIAARFHFARSRFHFTNEWKTSTNEWKTSTNEWKTLSNEWKGSNLKD